MRKNIVNEDFSAPGGQYMQLTGTTEGPRKVNLLDIVNFQKYLAWKRKTWSKISKKEVMCVFYRSVHVL